MMSLGTKLWMDLMNEPRHGGFSQPNFQVQNFSQSMCPVTILTCLLLWGSLKLHEQ
jgi:hypothetical protein